MNSSIDQHMPEPVITVPPQAPSTAKRFPVLKRISNAILAVLVIVITVNLWLMHSQNAQVWYSYESEQLGRSLALQASRMLAIPLENDDQQAINAFVSNIEADGFVTGSALYDEQGKLIKGYNQDYSVVALFRVQKQQPLIFIEDIVYEGKVIAYIKLVLDRDAIIAHHKAFNQSQLRQTLLIMVLTAICAAILTRLFYKVRRSYRVLEENIDR